MPGYLEVFDNFDAGHLKVYYAPQTLQYAISHVAILNAEDVKYVARQVAEALAKMYMDDIYKQLIVHPKLVGSVKNAQGYSSKSVLPNFATWTSSVSAGSPGGSGGDTWATGGGSGGSGWSPTTLSKPNAIGVLATLKAAVPGLAAAKARCPACPASPIPEKNLPLWDIIIHLNDGHKWEREAIADWLETLDYDLSFVPPSAQKPVPSLASGMSGDSINGADSDLSVWSKLLAHLPPPLKPSKDILKELGGGES